MKHFYMPYQLLHHKMQSVKSVVSFLIFISNQ